MTPVSLGPITDALLADGRKLWKWVGLCSRCLGQNVQVDLPQPPRRFGERGFLATNSEGPSNHWAPPSRPMVPVVFRSGGGGL